MTEKWVVVELRNDYTVVVDVHGIFESKSEAEWWAATHHLTYAVRRIKRAVVDEWA